MFILAASRRCLFALTLLVSLTLLASVRAYADTEAEARAILDWPEVGLARADGATRNVHVYFPYASTNKAPHLGSSIRRYRGRDAGDFHWAGGGLGALR
jgi:hypothetical protein